MTQPFSRASRLAALLIAAAACSTQSSDTPPPSVAGRTDPPPAAPAPTPASISAGPAPVAQHESAAGKAAGRAATLTVYKSPTCGCCAKWVDHMRGAGYEVIVHDTDDMAPVKAQLGVPERLGSCHTATVGGYVLEGHVPAADVARLLRERPTVAGLAVPGMPAGSPGMEIPGATADRYEVVAFGRDGATRVFASH